MSLVLSTSPAISSVRIRSARKSTITDSTWIEARQKFNHDLQVMLGWRKNNLEVTNIELWEAYSQKFQGSFESQRAEVFFSSIHPTWRAEVTFLLLALACTKMELDPFPDVHSDQSEARLWAAALGCSPRTAHIWELQRLQEKGEIAHGFGSLRHRLADLYRRAGRIDLRALRLYLIAYTGPRAYVPSYRGKGNHHSPSSLLQRGASISADLPHDEMKNRAQICAQLHLRGFAVPWVIESLKIARTVLKEDKPTLAQQLEKFNSEEKQLCAKQKPHIIDLANVLIHIAHEREREEAVQRFELEKLNMERQIEEENERIKEIIDEFE